MKQLHVKTHYNILYGGIGTFGLIDGGANGHYSAPSVDSSIPLPVAVTVRNLSLLCPVPGHDAITVNIQKNNSDAGLAVTIPAGTITPVKNITDSISFAAGDLIRGRITGTSQFFNSILNMSISAEFEADGAIYGVSAVSGAPVIGSGWKGGACGNGVLSSFSGTVYTPGNTKSLNAVAGNITKLCQYAFSGNPGSGIWTAYIIKNSVLQDGSGGTVDTSCVLTGANTFAVSTFSLPVAIQDILEIVIIRSGTNSSSAINQIAASCMLEPTTSGRFMFCGGSNSVLSTPIAYRWIESKQGIFPEEYASAVIGPNGVTCHGLYVLTNNPGTGKSSVWTVRRSLTDTDLTVTLTGTDTSGSDTTPDEIFPEDSIIDIEGESINGGNLGKLYWSLPISIAEPDSIIVQKFTDPSGDPQSFDFTAGGGLSPSTFSLVDGGVQVFDGLSPGTYSIAETPVEGWSTSISVSNGDDPSAITLGSGETVTVTVTNTKTSNLGSGIYKVVPGKRNDTIFTNASAEETIDVKIPDPFIKTAYLGE